MIGRLQFYFKKAMAEMKAHGLKGAVLLTLAFLKRRRFFLQFVSEWIEYEFTSRKRSLSRTVIEVLKTDPLTSSKILLYASFDSKSIILPHVIQQLDFFNSEGYQIVWVSTSPEVNPDEFEKIKAFVDIAIHRKNEGYDFASWAVGYLFTGGAQISSLVLMNDSCLGPEFDFHPLLSKMESEPRAVYGISKSYEIAEYIQSYFLHFGDHTIQTGVVTKYFSRIRILNSKWGIVRFFEIGGSKFLLKEGIPIKSLVDPKDPKVFEVMSWYQLGDPVKDPAGKEWIKRGLSPFYKRSNQEY